MKASELIKVLEQCIEEFGDLEVTYNNGYTGDLKVMDVHFMEEVNGNDDQRALRIY